MNDHETLYRLALSQRYHQRRARFLDLCDAWSRAVSVLAGTSAIGTILTQAPQAAVGLSAVVAVVGTLSLVFEFSTRARLHLDLARRYCELEAELLQRAPLDAAAVQQAHARLRAIEAEEPRTLGALVVLCQNEIARARGQEEHVVPLPLHHRLSAQLIDWTAPPPKGAA